MIVSRSVSLSGTHLKSFDEGRLHGDGEIFDEAVTTPVQLEEFHPSCAVFGSPCGIEFVGFKILETSQPLVKSDPGRCAHFFGTEVVVDYTFEVEEDGLQ